MLNGPYSVRHLEFQERQRKTSFPLSVKVLALDIDIEIHIERIALLIQFLEYAKPVEKYTLIVRHNHQRILYLRFR